MNGYSFCFLIVLTVHIRYSNEEACGCKVVRRCYQDMLNTLREKDEESCIEDASIGASTVMIFLKAIKQFCPDIITVAHDSFTYEGRTLYEVTLNSKMKDPQKELDKGVMIIEAGQLADTESVGLALFILEQLSACEENSEMIHRFKWVFLPSTNPDGLEYSRYNIISWKKNVRPSEDGLSYGVDISRNFEYQWASCEKISSGFSPDYPGQAAVSENETIFIKSVLNRHKKQTKLYLSIRRDGHALLYPFAFATKNMPGGKNLTKVAANVAAKINQRAGGVQLFVNETIYKANGKPYCGHSVDYAHEIGIPLAYEMRVFLGNDNRIMSKFQQLPRGYESSLRMGYFSGIRELYNSISDNKKGKIF